MPVVVLLRAFLVSLSVLVLWVLVLLRPPRPTRRGTPAISPHAKCMAGMALRESLHPATHLQRDLACRFSHGRRSTLCNSDAFSSMRNRTSTSSPGAYEIAPLALGFEIRRSVYEFVLETYQLRPPPGISENRSPGYQKSLPRPSASKSDVL